MTATDPASTCMTCRLNRGEAQPGLGGIIYQDGIWVLEHAIEPIPLVGWLVLKPYRHVEAFANLTDAEAAAFGPLTRRITQAMVEVLHPEKIYLSLYAEAEGFAHLHVHLIPRFGGTPKDRRGPRVFEYMADANRTGENQGDVVEAVRVAAEIAERLRRSSRSS